MLFLGPKGLRDFCYLLLSLGDFKFPISYILDFYSYFYFRYYNFKLMFNFS